MRLLVRIPARRDSGPLAKLPAEMGRIGIAEAFGHLRNRDVLACEGALGRVDARLNQVVHRGDVKLRLVERVKPGRAHVHFLRHALHRPSLSKPREQSASEPVQQRAQLGVDGARLRCAAAGAAEADEQHFGSRVRQLRAVGAAAVDFQLDLADARRDEGAVARVQKRIHRHAVAPHEVRGAGVQVHPVVQQGRFAAKPLPRVGRK